MYFISLWLLRFQTLTQSALIHNVCRGRNAWVCKWSLCFWLDSSLPLPLVLFHCSSGAHRSTALFGAQHEVESQRAMVRACDTILRLLAYNMGRLAHSGQRPEGWGLLWNRFIILVVFSLGRKTFLMLDHRSSPFLGPNMPKRWSLLWDSVQVFFLLFWTLI